MGTQNTNKLVEGPYKRTGKNKEAKRTDYLPQEQTRATRMIKIEEKNFMNECKITKLERI